MDSAPKFVEYEKVVVDGEGFDKRKLGESYKKWDNETVLYWMAHVVHLHKYCRRVRDLNWDGTTISEILNKSTQPDLFAQLKIENKAHKLMILR